MTHWKINDLKGVGDVELDLDDSRRVFVFFGSNGVGKTRILEALSLYYLTELENIQFSSTLEFNENNILFDKLFFDNVELSLADKLKYDSYHRYRLAKFSDVLSHTNCEMQAISLIFINQRNVAIKDLDSDYEHKRMSNDAKYLTTISIQIAVEKNQLRRYKHDKDIHHWFTERARSVNPYQKQEDSRQVDIDAVLEALHQLDNRFEKKLSIDADDHVYLTIDGQERELSELSSGFISVVKIIQSIISAYSAFTNSQDLLNVKGVVLIDEIESHLHVEWQTKIIPTLKDLFPNTTFYIATHSPLVLSQLHEGEAYLLKRDDDGVVRSEIIDSPNKRILQSVLIDAFDIDLNQLKRDGMKDSNQTLAKKRLLELLGDE